MSAGAPRNIKMMNNYKEMSYAKQSLTNAEVAQIVSPVSGRIIVDRIVLCERAGAAHTATIRFYPAGVALANAAAYNIFTAIPLAANETVVVDGPFYLYNGDQIAALADANTVVGFLAFYRQEN